MKIVYIYKSMAQLGGTERILTDKINYLSDVMKYQVTLITYEQGEHPLSFPLSPNVTHIDIGTRFHTTYGHSLAKRIYMHITLRRMFKSRLRKAIKRINPDFIITSTYSYSQIDIIVNIAPRSKYILEAHTVKKAINKENDFHHSKLLMKIAKAYDEYMLSKIKKFDLLVTLTKQDEKEWNNILPTIVIPNSVTQYPKQQAALVNKKIISVGRIEQEKGYDLLVGAWKNVASKHPDWQLDIYGDGSCKNQIQQLIKKAGIENSFFLKGATSDVYEKYLEHSIYVMSSRFEGFGLVLIEAMSCGLPCISFDCPSGPAEIITDNENGILVENGNICKLAEAICHLIENAGTRKQIGAKARESALKYSKENIMQQWDSLFHSLKNER